MDIKFTTQVARGCGCNSIKLYTEEFNPGELHFHINTETDF